MKINFYLLVIRHKFRLKHNIAITIIPKIIVGTSQFNKIAFYKILEVLLVVMLTTSIVLKTKKNTKQSQQRTQQKCSHYPFYFSLNTFQQSLANPVVLNVKTGHYNAKKWVHYLFPWKLLNECTTKIERKPLEVFDRCITCSSSTLCVSVHPRMPFGHH